MSESLLRRVEALELELLQVRQELRRATASHSGAKPWRAAALGAVCLLAGAVFLAADTPLVNTGTPRQEKITAFFAPFRVLDSAGKVIFEVKDDEELRGAQVVNQNEMSALVLGVAKSDSGGKVVVNDATGKGTVTISRDSAEDSGLITLRKKAGGAAVAQIGANGFEAFNSSGTPVAVLSAKSPAGKGTGYLALANASGSAVVEAGTVGERFGVVRTYPLGGAPPIPIPNFLVGHGFAQQGGGQP